MFGLNIEPESGRVLSATKAKYAPQGAVTVEKLPEGNLADYIYSEGKFILSPLPEEELKMTEDPIAALQREVESIREELKKLRAANENGAAGETGAARGNGAAKDTAAAGETGAAKEAGA